MMNCAPDVAKSSPLIAVRPRTSSPACHAVAEHRRFSVSAFVSRLLPHRSTATSRRHRPCRSSHSLHFSFSAFSFRKRPQQLNRSTPQLPRHVSAVFYVLNVPMSACQCLYLGCSRGARPLPARRYRPCRSPQSLHSVFLRDVWI
jgi:hypothetical protein